MQPNKSCPTCRSDYWAMKYMISTTENEQKACNDNFHTPPTIRVTSDSLTEEELARKAKEIRNLEIRRRDTERANKRKELIQIWLERWRVPYTIGSKEGLEMMMIEYAAWERMHEGV